MYEQNKRFFCGWGRYGSPRLRNQGGVPPGSEAKRARIAKAEAFSAGFASIRRLFPPDGKRISKATWLERGFAAFVVADADGLVDPADEYLSIANAAGARCADNRLNRTIP